jgi:hypothetical protein
VSLRIIGRNPDGSRHVIDDGPARARVAGYGGTLATHAITVPPSRQRRGPQPLAAMSRAPGRPRCGKAMRAGEPGARNPRHRDAHRSAEAMRIDARRW